MTRSDIERRIDVATLTSIRMLQPELLAPGAVMREFFGASTRVSLRSLFTGAHDDASWAHTVQRRIKAYEHTAYESDARVVTRVLRWVDPTDSRRVVLFDAWQRRRVSRMADPVVVGVRHSGDIPTLRAVTRNPYPLMRRWRDWLRMRSLWAPVAATALDMGGRGVTFGAATGAFVGVAIRAFMPVSHELSLYDWLVWGLGLGTLVGLVCGLSYFVAGVLSKTLPPRFPRLLRSRIVLFFFPFASSVVIMGVYRITLMLAG
ncbi:hypothetical protein [Microbacterium sp. YY-01]|uniref:hypothetical protein n=1 Tax=Microbacterium sp. YY-01 TaxID=3421634 RepID=UPI003D165A2F